MQNYENHKKIYKPHFFVFIPLALLLFGVSIYQLITSITQDNGQVWIWIVFSLIILLLIWFSSMTRVNYSLKLQNRIILHEVEYRYYRMTGGSLKEYEFEDEQIFALRFASDEEFIDLIKKTAKEQLSSDDIKKQIRNWQADTRRV